MGHVEDRQHLGGVAGLQHRHVGDGAHDGDVVDGLVGHPARGGDAGQEPDQTHGQVGVGDRHLQLVQRPAVQEDREGVQPRLEALAGQAGREPEHVLLGHPHGEEPVRVGVSPRPHLAGVGEVGRQHDEARLVRGEVDEVAHVGAAEHFDAPPRRRVHRAASSMRS